MISACPVRLTELEREPLQQRIEPGNFHRLEEIVREAGLPSRISIARATPPAYGNEYGAMPRGLQNPGDLEPIEAGHADVEQRQMRGHLLDELEGVRPIVGHVDLMASEPQEHRQHVGSVAIVLRDEDAQWYGHRVCDLTLRRKSHGRRGRVPSVRTFDRPRLAGGGVYPTIHPFSMYAR